MDTFPALDGLFKPHNIVIYTASAKLFYFINGLQVQQFPRDQLFLISPTEAELFGIRCTKSLDEVPPKEIDLCILAVARGKLLAAVKEILTKKSVKFFHIFTAGTSEADEAGLQIEVELQKLLSTTTGTRAIGPNCMGVYCPSGHNSYSAVFPTEPGNIGLIFHSGDLHSKFIIYGDIRHKLRFAKGVSVGNCLDLQVADFLAYFNTDPDCDFVCVYFEGFSRLHPREGQRFLRILQQMEKPVVFVRGGRSPRAQTAAKSHTGSLGSDTKIWGGIYRQTHCVEAGTSLDDFIDCAYLFQHFFNRYRTLSKKDRLARLPKSVNALEVIWSGGLGVLSTDELTELGLNLPLFEGAVKEKLLKILPLKVGSLSNPLDLPWIAGTPEFAKVVQAAIFDQIDVIIIESDTNLNWDPVRHEAYYNNLLQIKGYTERIDKLLLVILPEYPHPTRHSFYDRLMKDGFVVYPSVRRAAKAFLVLQAWGQRFKADSAKN